MCSMCRKMLPPELNKTKVRAICLELLVSLSSRENGQFGSVLWLDMGFGCSLRPWPSAHRAASVARQILSLPWTNKPERQVVSIILQAEGFSQRPALTLTSPSSWQTWHHLENHAAHMCFSLS